ncbi:MAG: BREX-1 system adenine-specific DNA-methyltransferase PglX [Deltaproteobacteria bacterium]|nr:BREX-1 system adenine-specific DNA-methyltransferase PglX [Deltaproteobacteria bacterium]
MDKPTRNLIQKATQDARRLLETEFREQLEGIFDILPNGHIAAHPGEHLNPRERIVREKIVAAIEHEKAGGVSNAEAVAGYLREASYTCLNRFAALKMMEGQGLVQECVSNGEQSSGFKEFCGLAPGLAELPDKGYRLYIESLFDELSAEIRVLFDRRDTASLLWPRRKAFEGLLDILNREEIAGIWGEDETIGWVYQYFNSTEERKKMREESAAPRNSRELAVRNQFFTPRYVVEFLADNTLGRIWHEMTQGKTELKDFCRYLVRRPVEIFLKPGEAAPVQAAADGDLSQEELLKQPVHIPYRPLKDPRTIRMLDPACGSMHFGLYSFDLFERIYEEAWELELRLGAAAFVREAGLKPLSETYPDKEAFLYDVPRLIIEHNIHGIDIDSRAVQIAGLSLWLRAQRSWHNQGVKPADRPRINRSNIVCAEPMPGEEDMRREFTAGLKPRVLGQIVDEVFDKMKLAGEAGSLLKIEEEIKEAVAAAKTQWEEQPKPVQMELFGRLIPARPVQMELRFDVKGITDEQFWEQAEDRILDSLREYAERAENGRALRRRLFAEDAARGFAFINLCRKQYDLVLMNPPYGDPSQSSRTILTTLYPETYFDIYVSFLERCHVLASNDGYIGAFTSRTFMNLNSHQYTRERITIDLRLLADLGSGVLDYAAVETAAYVVGRKPSNSEMSTFFKIDDVPVSDKGFDLLRTINHNDLKKTYIKHYNDFKLLPYSVLSYWIPDEIYRAFGKFSALSNCADVVVGIQTGDDERFARLWYEIKLGHLYKDYFTGVFGGEPQKFYRDFPLLINWAKGGAEMMNFCDENGKVRSRPQNRNFYFREGLTFIYTGAYFSVQPLPRESIITVAGQGIFPFDKLHSMLIIGLLNSYVSLCFAKIINPGRFFQAGYVSSIPFSTAQSMEDKSIIEAAVDSAIGLKIQALHFDETSRLYSTGINIHSKNHLRDALDVFRDWNDKFKETQTTLDVVSNKVLGISREAIEELSANFGRNDPIPLSTDVFIDEKIAACALMLSIGIAMSRWDIRIAKDPSLAPKLPDPFAPLPICPPGMLVSPNGLPAQPKRIVSEEWLRARPDANTLPPAGTVKNPTISDSEYPIRISWDGILVDDPGFEGGQLHKEDIVRRTREVLNVLWKNKAQDIEQEGCDILGVPDLRTYFRKSFFPDHIKRYSKSRRKAPIYWQLSTPSGSYSVWLYYHRFTKDTFYKLLNEYVNPKLQYEERELLSARQQYGQSPTASQRKEIAARETFVSELKAFKEEVARIAPLWDPDLNDGVIINFAPLWRLVPQNRSWQKECKTIWYKLVNGDYDWAHLAMHLWPERVVPKCTTDRSLAIAHGLNEALWEEDEKGKWHAKEISKGTLNALIQERASATVKAALEELLNASVANGASRRKSRRKS